MSKVNGVAIVFELHGPGESVVMPRRPLPRNLVLVVANVFARSLPSFACLLRGNLRVHQRLHAVIVQTVRLQEIDDVESVRPACLRVLQTEVEPLIVCLRIVIWLQDEIILEFIDLDGPPQVS